MPRHIGYHYTPSKNLDSIFKGVSCWFSSREYTGTKILKGLRPENRQHGFTPFDIYEEPLSCTYNSPSWVQEEYVFCFLEPEPKTWKENKEFPNIWKELMEYLSRNGSISLLSFGIMKSDDAHIIDRAWLERFNTYPYEEYNTLWQQFLRSRVPVSKYKSDYSLPELIISKTVSPNRLRVEKRL